MFNPISSTASVDMVLDSEIFDPPTTSTLYVQLICLVIDFRLLRSRNLILPTQRASFPILRLAGAHFEYESIAKDEAIRQITYFHRPDNVSLRIRRPAYPAA